MVDRCFSLYAQRSSSNVTWVVSTSKELLGKMVLIHIYERIRSEKQTDTVLQESAWKLLEGRVNEVQLLRLNRSPELMSSVTP